MGSTTGSNSTTTAASSLFTVSRADSGSEQSDPEDRLPLAHFKKRKEEQKDEQVPETVEKEIVDKPECTASEADPSLTSERQTTPPIVNELIKVEETPLVNEPELMPEASPEILLPCKPTVDMSPPIVKEEVRVKSPTSFMIDELIFGNSLENKLTS